jgi:DNA repair protein RadC
VVFGPGTAGRNAVDLARHTLTLHGSIGAVLDLNRTEFTALPGLGDAKFVMLKAGVEIGRRTLREEMIASSRIIDAAAAKAYLMAELGMRSRELFYALFLDTCHHVMAFEILSVGAINSATVHPREVVAGVIESGATAIIFAHNHPSGVSEPSNADTEFNADIVSSAVVNRCASAGSFRRDPSKSYIVR